MKDSMAKTLKKHQQATAKREQQKQQRDLIEAELQAAIKKRKTLELLCSSILKKNHDLYLKHETMLDEERQKRA